MRPKSTATRNRSSARDSELLQTWHRLALAGDEASRARLFKWVHGTALEYYETKSLLEPLISGQDAQDLASECIEEFTKAWTRIRSVCHYCRRMFKNNLRRYLKRRRRALQRECAFRGDEFEAFGSEYIAVHPSFEFEKLSDEDLVRYRIAKRELSGADGILRDLFHYRVIVGAMTYSEVADLLGATETSLRMRMTRFNRRVRRLYELEAARGPVAKDRGATESRNVRHGATL